MIAHEIRTPVTLIIGPLESLKEHWKQVSGKLSDGETITQTLSVIDRNAQRLLLLVNQLLDFNKVQQKGMQVHFRFEQHFEADACCGRSALLLPSSRKAFVLM